MNDSKSRIRISGLENLYSKSRNDDEAIIIMVDLTSSEKISDRVKELRLIVCDMRL